jgi:hypothetical protein
MSPDQFVQLLTVINRLTGQQYTITGAADWPILAAIGGILLLAIAAMWADLKATIKEYRTEWRSELSAVKSENDKDHDIIWDAIRDCQNDCCPRKKE